MAGANPNAWNNWYHCVGSTYGAWLPGDPRGFRTFRHRLHVEGDYKNPPAAGTFTAIYERSKRLMKRPAVVLGREQREVVCKAMIEQLQRDGVEAVALAIASNHFHLLARFPLLSAEEQARLSKTLLRDGRDPAPRHFLGLARKQASLALVKMQLKPLGTQVWGDRPLCEPVRDRRHQCNVARYICGHVKEDAAVWDWARGFLF